MLTALGATVIVEASASAAPETLRQERPDVRVSDLSMPDHDGFWLIAQVRALSLAEGGATPAAALAIATAITAASLCDRCMAVKTSLTLA